jgi:hypothetical protein
MFTPSFYGISRNAMPVHAPRKGEEAAASSPSRGDARLKTGYWMV